VLYVADEFVGRCRCSADGKYEVSYKPNVVIFNHGEVLWIPPAIYKSSCTIDVQYFPFDQQECKMKFGSWTFNGDQVSHSRTRRFTNSPMHLPAVPTRSLVPL